MLHVAGIKSLGILNLEEMNKKLTELLIPDGKRTEAEKSDDHKQLASALVTRLEETLDQAKATASRLSKLEGMQQCAFALVGLAVTNWLREMEMTQRIKKTCANICRSFVVRADATTGTGMYFREADSENASLTMRQTLLMRFMSQSTPELPDQAKATEMLNSLRRRFLGDAKNHGWFWKLQPSLAWTLACRSADIQGD